MRNIAKDCKCNSNNYSIRGKCHKCGGIAPLPYNKASEEPKEPSTARGKRRRANKVK